ncbi:MAG: fibronectin type III domain-containing protein, partial [Candidatus Hodarchaeota archaeon]
MKKKQFLIILFFVFTLLFIEGITLQHLYRQQEVKTLMRTGSKAQNTEPVIHSPPITRDLTSKVQEKVTRQIIPLILNQEEHQYLMENEFKNFSISLSAGQYLVWAERGSYQSNMDLRFDIATDDQFSNISTSVDNFGLKEDERYILDLSSPDTLYIRVTTTFDSGYFYIMVSDDINAGYKPLYLNKKLANQYLSENDYSNTYYCDVPAGNIQISVTNFDSADLVLNASFDPIVLDIYATSDNPGSGASEILDISFNETRTIYLKVHNKVGEDIYDILVSDHQLSTPTIHYPNGGEMLYGTINIQWSASTDPFGHSLTYQVSYSADGGSTWTTLAIGLTTTSYSWNTVPVLEGSNYLVKVVAVCSEGLTAEDTSNSTFTILPHLIEIIHSFILISVCLIFAAIGIYVIWTVRAKMRWPWIVGNLTSYDIKKELGNSILGIFLPGIWLGSLFYQANLIFTYYVDGVEYQIKKKSKRYPASRS